MFVNKGKIFFLIYDWELRETWEKEVQWDDNFTSIFVMVIKFSNLGEF